MRRVAYPHSAVEGRAGRTPLPDSGLPPFDRSASHLFGITLEQQFYSMEFFGRSGVTLAWLPQSARIMDGLGSNIGFGQAALEHIDALYGYAMTLTRHTSEAEDLVQETYVRATAAANQPDSNSNLKGWLFVIMRNTWLNQLRRQNSGPPFVDLDANEPAASEAPENPHVVYLRKLEQTQVREAIESLPDAYREIILLRDIEGFTYQEIATVLDCPAGTVMSRLGRARARLRKLLHRSSVKPVAITSRG
jgi:RNA polymerase sigma-70 factor (ECF subfamily)